MNLAKKFFSFIQLYFERDLTQLYLSVEKLRIYHFHIRKQVEQR